MKTDEKKDELSRKSKQLIGFGERDGQKGKTDRIIVNLEYEGKREVSLKALVASGIPLFFKRVA